MLTYQDITKHNQGQDLDEVIQVFPQTFRVQIHHDTSHANQSRATIKLLQPDFTWSPLLELLNGDWARDRVDGLLTARDTLLERAMELTL